MHQVLTRPVDIHSPFVAALLLLCSFGGCCCPSVWYDSQAFETWGELEEGVNETPPPATKMGGAKHTIEEQTGVTMKLPRVFAYTGPNKMTTLVPGTNLNNNPVPIDRLKPYLVKGEQPVIADLPGLKLTYEMLHGDSQPVYCYIGVLPKGNKAYADAKSGIQDAIKAADAGANWEPKTIEGSINSAEYIESVGPQGFVRPTPLQAQQLAGRLGIYLMKSDHATIWIGYRGPKDLAKGLALFKAGEAALATLKSVEPAKEIVAGAGGSATPDTSDPANARANLRSLGVALQEFHNSEQSYPRGTHADQLIKFSWQVQLLAYLQEGDLRQRVFSQFANKPWNDPSAQALLADMPDVFSSPPSDKKGMTRFRVFSGPGTLFPNQRGMGIQEIRDGTSGTLLAIEVGPDKAVAWIQPGGIPIESANLLAELGAPRQIGYMAILSDGSVVTLRKDITEKTLRALISPAGSEVVNRTDYLAQ